MSEAFLSRIRLKEGVATRSLAPLLLPDGQGPRTGAIHRIVWSLFADDPSRNRDFIWREDIQGDRSTVYTLSRRPPIDHHSLFEIDTKPFEPYLAEGQRLSFVLRVNAVTNCKIGDGKHSEHQRSDIVMAAMKRSGLGRGQYAEGRDRAAISASRDWLRSQGAVKGFSLSERNPDPLLVINYSTTSIARRSGAPIRFGILDLAGEVVVERPDDFISGLIKGFGKGKAFGYGLMMVRKAA